VSERPGLPDGLVLIVKRDCATCRLVEPVMADVVERFDGPVTVYSQDDPDFPESITGVIHDDDLAVSWHHDIETVPTVIRVHDGTEVERAVGWLRDDWERVTGIAGLGPDLPDFRPGCGSLSVDPDRVDELRARHGGSVLRSRRVEAAAAEDEAEVFFNRGWTDGLPVVPPTEERVLRMLTGTPRAPDEVVAVVPPDLVECTVEKVAINAVMAGCLPEHMPVVLAAVEASCTDSFNMHGLIATTWFSGPVVMVNGPIAERIGMNSGHNCLGQGNRANATIGRALQLVVRNVGGGRPGEIDKATLGQPGKYTHCFAEREHDSPWEPYHVSQGIPAGRSAVTLFAGGGVQGVFDQLSREPESLCRTFAECLRVVASPKMAIGFDAMLVVSPEHARVFRDAGWSRDQLLQRLTELLTVPGTEVVRGARGIAEGLPGAFVGVDIPKFRPGGLLVVHAGGAAGLFSAIIGGWASGDLGSTPVTQEVRT